MSYSSLYVKDTNKESWSHKGLGVSGTGRHGGGARGQENSREPRVLSRAGKRRSQEE